MQFRLQAGRTQNGAMEQVLPGISPPPRSPMHPKTILATLALLTAVLFYLTHNRTGLPRVGGKGPIGFILTALRSIMSYEELLNEGWQKFGGKPFILPTMAGQLIVLGPENLDLVRTSDDSVINQPIVVHKLFQLAHTMNSRQMAFPYHATVVRTDLTRAISSFIPEIVEETQLAMAEAFSPKSGEKSVVVPLFKTVLHFSARIVTRAMISTTLCRNEVYLREIIRFAETVVPYSQILRWFPKAFRPPIYFLLSSLFGGSKAPIKTLLPHLKRLLAEREQHIERNPRTICDFLIDHAPSEEIANPELLAMRVLHLNFGSVHSLSAVGTFAIFHLATLSAFELDDIRRELIDALESEGGFSKSSLSKMCKLDSTLRETARFYRLAFAGLPRFLVKPATLADGTVIPAGYNIAFPLKRIHYDATVYPNPEKFEWFRFSNLREEDGSGAKHQFTTVGKDLLLFGLGRHACPGRFFASMELKILLSHLLLHYDVSLADGAKEVPKPTVFSSNTIPSLSARAVITPRLGQAGQKFRAV
ncbi:Ent-kaurene oxidase [Favolaschia claudopus]|uniref:Ent-kaurene oxidase n=1 Tax=Favolaschia claudopus TaxID=2862362 RepID=A0AAW0EGX2_9AGAR